MMHVLIEQIEFVFSRSAECLEYPDYYKDLDELDKACFRSLRSNIEKAKLDEDLLIDFSTVYTHLNSDFMLHYVPKLMKYTVDSNNLPTVVFFLFRELARPVNVKYTRERWSGFNRDEIEVILSWASWVLAKVSGNQGEYLASEISLIDDGLKNLSLML